MAASAWRGACHSGDGATRRHRRNGCAARCKAREIDEMTLLETVSLKKYFGDTHAVDDVNLTIAEGEFISVVGPNGAGKTSLCNVISAHLAPDSGKIIFKGRDVTHSSVIERVKAGIARSFQLVNLFDDLTAFDNVALAIFARDGKIRNMAALADRDREVTIEADTVLDQFGLASKRNEPARGLAQGERKLLDVALAYALRPKLLFLDEPTSGVSTREKDKIMDIIASVVRGEGITAAIIEHDMDVVFKYSNRIVVMHQGAILVQGTPDAIRNNDDVAMILLGSSGPDAFSRKE
ncbi:ABC transporter ATP-binding protein [Bradyrhizobium genosp. SA-3]|uniref:ABC transporter ATP-binding protein n=1 Tax=Bradyrhizobium genosp. SA-3 TaxID=508868 RepID=UPI00102980A0|nr:ABC transporter ATP-binding protein [Bradyrhizobium genosp. SA-3]